MDGVTQLQNYLASISSFMTHSLQAATYESLSTTTQQVGDAIRARADVEKSFALTEAAQQPQQQQDGVAPVKDEGTLANGTGDASSGSPALVPELTAALHSGLHPSVEFLMADRAHQIFKRVMEADVLIQSLPDHIDGEKAHQAQMEKIAFLERCNEQVGAELEAKQEEARLWQKRVAFIMEQAAACQLKSSVQPLETVPTTHSDKHE